MSEHEGEPGAGPATSGTATSGPATSGPATEEKAIPDFGLRFEKQEIDSFMKDDQQAGKAIGQLLAVLFCVLLILMVTATVWTAIHQNISDDPYASSAQDQNDH